MRYGPYKRFLQDENENDPVFPGRDRYFRIEELSTSNPMTMGQPAPLPTTTHHQQQPPARVTLFLQR